MLAQNAQAEASAAQEMNVRRVGALDNLQCLDDNLGSSPPRQARSACSLQQQQHAPSSWGNLSRAMLGVELGAAATERAVGSWPPRQARSACSLQQQQQLQQWGLSAAEKTGALRMQRWAVSWMQQPQDMLWGCLGRQGSGFRV